MRRSAQALAVTGAVIGLCLTALPATASALRSSAAGDQARAGRAAAGPKAPTPAELRAVGRLRKVSAEQGQRGSITGLVLGPNGRPAADVCVQARGARTTRTAFTRPDGQFLIGGLPLGQYRVEYRGCSPAGDVTGQWYGGPTRAAAALVFVGAKAPTELAPVRLGIVAPRYLRANARTAAAAAAIGKALRQSPVALIDQVADGTRATLPAAVIAAGAGKPAAGRSRPTRVSGVVTSAASGKPLAGVCVIAVPKGARFLIPYGAAVTGRNGGYGLRLFAPGRYLIDFLPSCGFGGDYAPQLWHAADSAAKATPLRVRSHQQVGHIDAKLGVGAQITGRVHAAKSPHPPLASLCVTASGTGGQRYFTGAAPVRDDGSFRLPDLATGSYLLSVAACRESSPYLPATFNRPVAVTDGKTTGGVTLTVRIGGAITGKVTAAGGHGLAGICAVASYRNDFHFVSTRKGGGYTLQGLPTGRYSMSFGPGCGNQGGYSPVTRPGRVEVTQGKTTAGIDAVLPLDGSLSGLVTGHGGKPLPGICVIASNDENGAFAVTGPDGTYDLAQVPVGTYEVDFVPGGAFSDCGNNGNYLPATESATISSGTATTLNAVLPAGGVISGVVTGPGGHPLAGVCVFSTGESFFGNQIRTRSDGSYRIGQLYTGSYEVAFIGGCGNPGSVAPQAYRGDPTGFAPAQVAVTQGADTTGIDARMRPGGTISGRTTTASGGPADGVCVSVLAITGAGGGGEYGGIGVSRHGAYGVPNLPPGQYEVLFSGLAKKHRGCVASVYADQQFSGRGAAATPDLVSVAGGSVTRGVNATLSLAGKISGVVRNKAGHFVTGICVTATDRATGAGGETISFRHGRYLLPDLPAGRYQVEFTNCGIDAFFIGSAPNYANQWYKDSVSRKAAAPVTVKPGRTTPGIDAALTAGGTISGQVVFRPDGRPVSYVCVYAFTANFGSFGAALTDRRGHYRIDGLSTGRYLIEFVPCSYETALAGQAKAKPIALTAGHRISGIDETLQVGGSVSGTVRYQGAGPARPAPGTCVELIPVSATSIGQLAITGTGGSFTDANLAPGRYGAIFGDPGCSSDSPSLTELFASGTVTVAARHTTAGADATLRPTGTISGRVTGPAGPLTGICAEAESAGAATVVGITAAGRYQIAGLQPGTYRVKFTSGCGATGYATRWYRGARTAGGATPVVVRADATTANVNGKLPRG